LFFLGFWKRDAKATQRTLKDYLTAQKPQDRVFKTDEFLAQGHATPAHDLVDFIEGKVFKPTARRTRLQGGAVHAARQQWRQGAAVVGAEKVAQSEEGASTCLRDSADEAAGYVSDTRCR